MASKNHGISCRGLNSREIARGMPAGAIRLNSSEAYRMKWYNLLMTALLAITVSGAVALADANGVAASFTSDFSGGAAPVTVQFTDTSGGSPTGWQWDFGDGSPVVTDQNPSHTFQAAGTYVVTLTVTDGTYTATTNGEILVDADATPTPATTAASLLSAAFTSDVTDGQAPLAVQFTDASAGSPTGWQCDFGDGSPVVMDQNPSHTFQAEGSYVVTLTVTDGSQNNTTMIPITVEAAPTAQPVADTATPAPAAPTATPSPALPAEVTVLTLIAAAGLVLVIGKAGKK
jgi:large repetitive protein